MIPSVLIVDDSQDNCELMKVLFETSGAKTKLMLRSSEVAAAVKAAKRLGEPFDMIVIDIMMPELNGFELATNLRKDGYDGPIIAVTSALDGFGRKKGKEVGITSYLSRDTLTLDLARALLSAHVSS
jgi:CheY-like chemotaxis protein